jgi:uncharacterized protein YceK
MKYICVALITLLLTGCLKVNRVTATEASAPAEVFSPIITGRACVNGNSMIRVRFVSADLTTTAPADVAMWVYEYTSSSYHIKTC